MGRAGPDTGTRDQDGDAAAIELGERLRARCDTGERPDVVAVLRESRHEVGDERRRRGR
jgi:hypothetical protein